MSGTTSERHTQALTRDEWDQVLPGLMIVLDDIGLWLRPRARHAGVFARQCRQRATRAMREAWPAVAAPAVRASKMMLLFVPLALRDAGVINVAAFWGLVTAGGGVWLGWELAGSGRRQVGRCRLRRTIGPVIRNRVVRLHEGTAADDLAPAVVVNSGSIERHDEEIGEIYDVLARICRQAGIPVPPALGRTCQLRLIKGGVA